MRNLLKIIWLFVSAFALIACHTSHADTIYLESGDTISGDIIKEDSEKVVISTGKANITIKRSRIKSIDARESAKRIYLERLELLKTDSIDEQYEIATFCAEKNLIDEAIQHFRKVVAIDPAYKDANRRLISLASAAALSAYERAESALQTKNLAEAESSLNQIITLYHESSHITKAKLLLAKVSLALENYDKAEALLWEIIAKPDPANQCLSEAERNLALVYEAKKAWVEAINTWNELRKSDAEGKYTTEIEDHERILREIAKCQSAYVEDALATSSQKQTNFLIQLKLGDLYQQLGLTKQAMSLYRELIEKTVGGTVPVHVAPYRRLALLYRKQGKPEESEKVWKRLQKSDDPAASEKAYIEIKKIEAFKKYGDFCSFDDLPDPDVLNEIEVLINHYFEVKRKPAYDEILEKLGRYKVPFRTFEAVVRYGKHYEKAPTGLSTCPVRVKFDNTILQYTLYAPTSYDPERRWPLIVGLHGAHGRGEIYIRMWERYAEDRGYLVVCPTANRRFGFGHNRPGQSIVLSTIEAVKERYNVEPDRVYLDGTSMGGLAAYDLGTCYPDWFAAIVPRAGSTGMKDRLLPNLHLTPAYILHGKYDKLVTVAKDRATAARLKELGYDYVYKEFPERGHETFEDQNDKILDWLETKKRNLYPKEVIFSTDEILYNMCRWIKLDELQSRGPPLEQFFHGLDKKFIEKREVNNNASVIRAKVFPGNRIRVATRDVKKYTIFLSDKFIDLDKEIKIFTNKKLSFSGKAPRALDTMLALAKTYGRDRVFASFIPITVGRKTSITLRKERGAEQFFLTNRIPGVTVHHPR